MWIFYLVCSLTYIKSCFQVVRNNLSTVSLCRTFAKHSGLVRVLAAEVPVCSSCRVATSFLGSRGTWQWKQTQMRV